MFDKKKDNVVLIHFGSVVKYPPVINIVECLLQNKYSVVLVSEHIEDLPLSIRENHFFIGINIAVRGLKRNIPDLCRRIKRNKLYRNAMKKYAGNNGLVWTTNDLAVRTLNKSLLPYQSRHIMQLMELVDWCPLFTKDKVFGFDLQKYARNAWKTVVPEQNRAYIQKAQWNLNRLPYVLPNKTYSIQSIEPSLEMLEVLQKMQDEPRKIIVYLGIVGQDRDLGPFMDAIERLKEKYCMYIFGGVAEKMKDRFKDMCAAHPNTVYAGYYKAPMHLNALQFAYAAILPYRPFAGSRGDSVLNALYCAPNKIFEYSGQGVPMIGSDVPGLKIPFEKFGIGVCCDDKQLSIEEAIEYVSQHHDEMKHNCKLFYDSVNLDDIIERIVNEK